MLILSLIRSGAEPKEVAFIVLCYLFALSIAFAVHEFAHAWSAHLLGDDTARDAGRLTLLPTAHIDPVGMILLILLGFGWGKPVPVNPNNFTKIRSKTLSEVIVSLSGILANFILAFVTSIASVFISILADGSNMWIVLISTILGYLASINLNLMAFNLIPIPPLDGFSFINSVLPVKARYSNAYRKFVNYAPRVFFYIIMIGSFVNLSILTIVIEIIKIPATTAISTVSALIFIALT